jgi:glycosyltransferase involved in cell wall biosynthesis
MKKKVLVIAHAFPPIGGIGALRAVKFVRYLPHFGWQPVVLTVKRSESFMPDASLLEDLPEQTPIYRARSWEPLNAARMKQAAERVRTSGLTGTGRWSERVMAALRPLYFALHIPDDKVGWLPGAIRLGRKLLGREAIDLIWATAPPYTCLLVGRALKRYGNKPFVADYRDEWTTIRYRDHTPSPATTFLNRRLERSVLGAADMVVTATAPIADRLRREGLLRPPTPHVDITNGFDPADGDVPVLPPRDDRFTIVYTGSFGERQTPKYFLQALAELLRAHAALRSRMRVCFVGPVYQRQVGLIRECGLSDVVELPGMVSHRQAIGYQLAADVLLLIVGKGPGSEVVLTGKIFEYLGAQRPILALVPRDGPAARLIHDTATGHCVDTDDVGAIAQALQSLHARWTAGGLPYAPHLDLVNRFRRRELTRQLAGVFDALVAAK